MASIAGYGGDDGSRARVGRMPAWPWALAGLAVVVIGFWPTFFGDPLSNDALHTLHGAISTLWVVLLIAQSVLIGQGRHRLHRRFGWASLALVGALLASSGWMVWLEITEPATFSTTLMFELIYLDIALLALFVALYAGGIALRRRRALHLRLMGSTVLVGMIPALGRFFGINFKSIGGLAGALGPSFWTVDAILVAAILIDWRRGQLLWPFPAVLAAFVALEAAVPLFTTAPFVALARSLGAPY